MQPFVLAHVDDMVVQIEVHPNGVDYSLYFGDAGSGLSLLSDDMCEEFLFQREGAKRVAQRFDWDGDKVREQKAIDLFKLARSRFEDNIDENGTSLGGE